MIAVVTVRGGVLAAGAEEAIAEAGGVAVLAGEGAAGAAAELADRAAGAGAGGECRELRVLELGGVFRPGAWAGAIAAHLEDDPVAVLPASPDGRDLAPRLAAELSRPLLAGALSVTAEGATVVRRQGRQIARLRVEGPFVATLLPGSRTARAAQAGSPGGPPSRAETSRREPGPAVVELPGPAAGSPAGPEPEQLEVAAAEGAVLDLAEAARVVAGGAGLGGPEALRLLGAVAAKLGASLGATRVATDAGWLGHERQIGTTGVSVRPRCYLAFGVSGAAQHLGGLGAPRHVVSVNLDPSCPMMAMADLALVTDAPALVEALARRLCGPEGGAV